MTARSLCLSVLVVAASGAAAVPPARVGEPPPGTCSRAKLGAALLAAGQRAPALRASAIDLVAGASDVLHYALDLEIDVAHASVKGSNTFTATSLVEGLAWFRFRLHRQLAIDDVEVDGRPASWQRLDDATVEVAIAPAIHLGDEFSLKVVYHGTPPSQGWAIVFRSRVGQPEAATLSEPWYAYLWWPTKDDNDDKASAEMSFTVPGNLVAVSNGVLAGVDTLAGGKKRFRWVTQYPTAPYLFFFAVTNYHTFTDYFPYDGGTMPLEFYIYPEHDTPANRAAWLTVRGMLQAFSGLYGAYPFLGERYGIYEFPFNGGMEHQTSAGQGGFDQTLSAHELSHQWWGDMVTCATWSDIWLNEGFATYSEALWAESQAQSDPLAALRAEMMQLRPTNPNGSVYIPAPTTVARVFSRDLTYLKGGWVLHMLRHVLGDEAFFAALRDYQRRHAYGSATTADFRAAVEASSGRDLGWFFDEWVFGSSVPSYSFAWREYVVAGRTWVDLYLAQAGDGAPVFTMPLDVRVTTDAGQVTERVEAAARSAHFLIPGEGLIYSVDVDPDDWVLTGAVTNVPFVEGPPRIVTVDPAPGSVQPPGRVTAVRVTFHKDVAAQAADFTLTGVRGGSVPFTFQYDPATTSATLSVANPLINDQYTVTVSDAVTDRAAGLPLDGEVARPEEPDALPSGNGQPGGRALVRFWVVNPPRLRVQPSH